MRAVVAACALVVVASGCALRPRVERFSLRPTDRLLVVAPHPDDETIAAGGLIATAASMGIPVRVVWVTSGDGYPDALGGKPATPEAFRELGRIREAEGREAITRLGVSPEDGVFLGFPDGGVTALWVACWDRPFRSPYTRREETAAGLPYTGAAQYEGLVAEMGAFRPTIVVAPHPADTHSDHEYVGRFAIAAVGKTAPDAEVLGYLVHDPLWPPAVGGSRHLPPPSTPDITSWVEFPLAPETLDRKRHALDAHMTQLLIMRGLLERFAGPREVFSAPSYHRD